MDSNDVFTAIYTIGFTAAAIFFIVGIATGSGVLVLAALIAFVISGFVAGMKMDNS